MLLLSQDIYAGGAYIAVPNAVAFASYCASTPARAAPSPRNSSQSRGPLATGLSRRLAISHALGLVPRSITVSNAFTVQTLSTCVPAGFHIVSAIECSSSASESQVRVGMAEAAARKHACMRDGTNRWRSLCTFCLSSVLCWTTYGRCHYLICVARNLVSNYIR